MGTFSLRFTVQNRRHRPPVLEHYDPCALLRPGAFARAVIIGDPCPHFAHFSSLKLHLFRLLLVAVPYCTFYASRNYTVPYTRFSRYTPITRCCSAAVIVSPPFVHAHQVEQAHVIRFIRFVDRNLAPTSYRFVTIFLLRFERSAREATTFSYSSLRLSSRVLASSRYGTRRQNIQVRCLKGI